MARRGNPVALMNGIPKNHRMSPSAKRKAMKTLRAQVRGMRMPLPKIRRHRPSRNLGQGMEGFRETGVATVKLLSHPVAQAIEGYHVVNGIRKMWKAIDRWLNSL